MREDKLSLNKLSKRYPLTCRHKFSLSISALFLTFSFRRLTVWWSSDLCNQRERGVEPLGTKLRNTLFSLFVPLSNRWRFIFNMLLSNLIFVSFLHCRPRIAANVEAAWRSGGLTVARAGAKPPKLHCRLCGLHPPLCQTASCAIAHFIGLIRS